MVMGGAAGAAFAVALALAGAPAGPARADVPRPAREVLAEVTADLRCGPEVDLLHPPAAPCVDVARGLIAWPPVAFELSKATLRAASLPVVDALGRWLAAHPEVSLVEIQGHREPRPDDGIRAVELTQRRAETIRAALVQRSGIDPRRLVARGYAAEVPLVPPRGKDAALNRRIELHILAWRDVTLALPPR